MGGRRSGVDVPALPEVGIAFVALVARLAFVIATEEIRVPSGDDDNMAEPIPASFRQLFLNRNPARHQFDGCGHGVIATVADADVQFFHVSHVFTFAQ